MAIPVGRIARRAILAIAFAGLCGACLWIFLVTSNDMPPWEATEVARRKAVVEGHSVQDSGSIGQYIRQPDSLGGCEVVVIFGLPPSDEIERDVAVRLWRSSALMDWRVTSVVVRESPVKTSN